MFDFNRVTSNLSKVIRNQLSDHRILERLEQQTDGNHKTYESSFDSLDQSAADSQNSFDNIVKRFDYFDKLHDDA